VEQELRFAVLACGFFSRGFSQSIHISRLALVPQTGNGVPPNVKFAGLLHSAWLMMSKMLFLCLMCVFSRLTQTKEEL
jgi:hypothetical protein